MLLVSKSDAGGSTRRLADTLATAAEHTGEGCTDKLVENKERGAYPLSVCQARYHHPHASNFRLFESRCFRGASRAPKSSTNPTAISTETSLNLGCLGARPIKWIPLNLNR